MQHKWLIASWMLLGTFISPLWSVDLQFPNPSLEEDTANIGLPDGWKIPNKDKTFRETVKVSHGRRAMRFVDCGQLIYCDLKAEKIAGLKLKITFDAAGTPGTRYGVIVGKMRKNSKGKLWWNNSTMHWGGKLTEDYKPVHITYTLPNDSVGDRIFFAVYNLPGKGTVWLDNFNLLPSYVANLTKEQKKQLVIQLREWTYLNTKLDNALKQQPQNAELKAMKQESKTIMDRLGRDDVKMLAPEYQQKLQAYQLKCNQILAQKKAFVSYFEDAYTRLDSSRSIAAQRPQQTKLVTLGNEYQALGIVVASAKADVQNLPITISGGENAVERIQVRRQVFMNNWYNRDKRIATDPLTLLQGAKGNWQLELAPGVVEKLYVGLKFKANLKGNFPLTIKVGNQTLIAQIEMRSSNLPTKPCLGHLQCLYTWLPPSAPDAAKDLAEHYVTAIEFPICPDEVRFNADGSLVQENVRFPLDVIKSYADQNIKLALYWQGYYKSFKFEDGQKMPFIVNDELNPLWIKAYKNLLNAYFKTAARYGYTEKHFLNWIWDELGSGRKWEQAPTPQVRNAIKIYQASKAARPELARLITAGNSTTPKDVRAYAAEIEIMVPHWTLPETSSHSWGGKNTNPRKAFFTETLPFIQERQKNHNLTLWSYKIDAGKGEKVLNARAYPLCAVAMNLTGVGSWAYNVTRNRTTWDDTDGGLLDYIFIYDGCEKHPLNTKYNITKERVVPSIRWEAFRKGIQDAKILLYLKSEMEQGKLPTSKQEAVKKILAELRVYAEKLNYTQEALERISTQLRELI